MANIYDLPVELLLKILSSLELKSLIAARGVCSCWRSLIPSQDIPAVRCRLLTLYLRLVHSPAFHASRPAIVPHLRPFNRKAFLARLPTAVPEEFRMWILEWPSRAVFEWMWPGLPEMCPREPVFPDITRHGARNTLAKRCVSQLWMSRRAARGARSHAEPTKYDGARLSDVPCDAQAVEIHVLRLVSGAQRSHLDLVTYSANGLSDGAVFSWKKCPHEESSVVAESWLDYLELELEKQEAEVSDEPLVPW